MTTKYSVVSGSRTLRSGLSKMFAEEYAAAYNAIVSSKRPNIPQAEVQKEKNR